MRHAVYAGIFDPYTKGHGHILKQALSVFDKVTLAIGVNATKPSARFSLLDRLVMLDDIASTHLGRVDVASFDITGEFAEYQVNFAESIGANHIIRGIRNNADFEYEHAMAQVNKKINPRINTVFFMAEQEYAAISSSMVKGLIGPQGWQTVVMNYMPLATWDRFVRLVGDSC